MPWGWPYQCGPMPKAVSMTRMNKKKIKGLIDLALPNDSSRIVRWAITIDPFFTDEDPPMMAIIGAAAHEAATPQMAIPKGAYA